MVKPYFTMVLVVLVGCASSQQYTASSPRVLVEPSRRVWLKPDSTMEDENAARNECGEELQSNEQMRRGSMDAWSAAFRSCMQGKGFRRYKDR